MHRAQGTARRFTNIAATVGNLTAKYGYFVDVKNVEGMTLREQARLFYAYDTVATIHGAGLSNVLFMRPSAILIDIRPPRFFPAESHQWPRGHAKSFANTSVLSVLVDPIRLEPIWEWISGPRAIIPGSWNELSLADQAYFRQTRKCPEKMNQYTCIVLWGLYGSNIRLVVSDFRRMLVLAAAQRARGKRFDIVVLNLTNDSYSFKNGEGRYFRSD